MSLLSAPRVISKHRPQHRIRLKSLDPQVIKTLEQITTATITTILLTKGLRNV